MMVEAAMTASDCRVNKDLGRAIEAAMTDAVKFALAHGISDPEEIKALKLQAREDIKARYADWLASQ